MKQTVICKSFNVHPVRVLDAYCYFKLSDLVPTEWYEHRSSDREIQITSIFIAGMTNSDNHRP